MKRLVSGFISLSLIVFLSNDLYAHPLHELIVLSSKKSEKSKKNKDPKKHKNFSKSELKKFVKLLEKGENPNITDSPFPVAPIHLAIELNQPEFVKVLIGMPTTDLNFTDKNGRNPLHVAVEKNQPEVVKDLLETKIEINAFDGNKKTALQIAVEKDYSHIVEMILQHPKVEPNRLSRETTILHIAAEENAHKSIPVLLNRSDIQVNATDWLKRTPMEISLASQSADAAVLLGRGTVRDGKFEAGDLDLTNRGEGYNVFHLAFLNLKYDYFTDLELIKRNPNLLFKKNDHNETPIDILIRDRKDTFLGIVLQAFSQSPAQDHASLKALDELVVRLMTEYPHDKRTLYTPMRGRPIAKSPESTRGLFNSLRTRNPTVRETHKMDQIEANLITELGTAESGEFGPQSMANLGTLRENPLAIALEQGNQKEFERLTQDMPELLEPIGAKNPLRIALKLKNTPNAQRILDKRFEKVGLDQLISEVQEYKVSDKARLVLLLAQTRIGSIKTVEECHQRLLEMSFAEQVQFRPILQVLSIYRKIFETARNKFNLNIESEGTDRVKLMSMLNEFSGLKVEEVQEKDLPKQYTMTMLKDLKLLVNSIEELREHAWYSKQYEAFRTSHEMEELSFEDYAMSMIKNLKLFCGKEREFDPVIPRDPQASQRVTNDKN